ncbi:hypothetical protein PF007_g3793 [Phytophthora fragariae]|uniref:Uncharacterized protein n=1 Tax=Phytophthora fragariae TaxID=53985 RepID=A0A6A3T9H1_9STRA|nr:hypothetical protein PF009_g4162 [Phytophthora fragariae]KAE9132262.1 hypothetical protein PF007_g3793 [Phytophthora fragariae]
MTRHTQCTPFSPRHVLRLQRRPGRRRLGPTRSRVLDGRAWVGPAEGIQPVRLQLADLVAKSPERGAAETSSPSHTFRQQQRCRCSAFLKQADGAAIDYKTTSTSECESHRQRLHADGKAREARVSPDKSSAFLSL